MTTEALLAFFLVSVVATATPGPAILYVLSAGISGGSRGSGLGTLGILSADAVYFLLTVAGLGTFLLASYSLFVLIKWIGAAYLLWLGARLLWLAVFPSDGPTLQSPQTQTRRGWLAGGFAVHAANPKALLYFGSIVPQFVRPERALLPQIATLGVIHLLTATTVMLAYGFFAARIGAYARNAWFSRTLHGVAGTMLIAAGAGLASIKRRIE